MQYSDGTIMSIRVVEAAARSTSDASPRAGPGSYSAAWSVALLASDVAMFLLSSYIAAQIWLVNVHHWTNPFLETRLVIAQGLYVCLWVVLFERLGLYRRSYALTVKDELYYTTAALLLGTVPQLVLFTIAPGISTSRAIIALSLPFSIVMVGASRTLARVLRDSPVFQQRKRVAIVGKPERVELAFDSLDLPADAQALLLAVDDIDAMAHDGTAEFDVHRIEWFARARAWGCDTLLLTEMVQPELMPYLLEASARNQIHLAFAPPKIQRYSYNLALEINGHQALIVPTRLNACTPRARLHKRIVDIVCASAALLIFAPVMILAAAAVYFESGAPVLYRQRRVGKGGVPFSIFKFRSMKHNAEALSGPVWAAEGDDRRTAVGAILRRYSIDEFPQLFNVLRGEMSLVGPRPERPEFVEVFRHMLPRYDERHFVPPGITGWSQVHMRRVLQPSEAAEKLKYDLQYVEQWSPFLDISILVQTAFEFLFHRAA